MTQAVTLAQAGNSNGTFRNKIINGAMMISQRNGTTATSAINGAYCLDRYNLFSFSAGNATTGKYTVTQSSSAPAGFSNSLLVTSSTTTAANAGDVYGVGQVIEGLNTVDLAWGTSSGKPVTLSFWVQSSLTGTFGGTFRNQNATHGFPFSYTIGSANTWTQIIITIPAPPSGSTWQTDNSQGIYLWFSIQMGATYSNAPTGSWISLSNSGYGATGGVNLLATSGATWYLTGLQLEAGTVPTAFELRSYSKELMMCQRYCQVVTYQGYETLIGVGMNLANNRILMDYPLKVQMRTQPSASVVGSVSQIQNIGGGTWYGAQTVGFSPNPYACRFDINYAAGYFTQNGAAETRIETGTSVVISAEL
jgi:hypothetical protein